MQLSLTLLSLAASAMAAYVPSEPWSTLTPAASHSCAATAYSKTFGIAIQTITSQVNVNAKRDVVTQIGDGQIQAPTSGEDVVTPTSVKSNFKPSQSDEITYETDYVTHTMTKTKTTNGQTVEVPETSTDTVVFTKTVHHFNYESVKVPAKKTGGDVVVTQIGDGQIQAAKPTATSGSVAPTRALSAKPSSSHSSSARASSSSAGACATDGPIAKVSTCKSDSDLAVSLVDGVLTDAKGRLGSIVSNRQFQFDGPPPQAGAIYAAGWGIVDGHLSLGEDEIFWECLSGDFYNLYDQYIAEQCIPVYLNVVDLVDC